MKDDLNDINVIAALAGFGTLKPKEDKRDACAIFMDDWKEEQRKRGNGPIYTND